MSNSISQGNLERLFAIFAADWFLDLPRLSTPIIIGCFWASASVSACCLRLSREQSLGRQISTCAKQTNKQTKIFRSSIHITDKALGSQWGLVFFQSTTALNIYSIMHVRLYNIQLFSSRYSVCPVGITARALLLTPSWETYFGFHPHPQFWNLFSKKKSKICLWPLLSQHRHC